MKLQRFQQISESHCGPAVLQTLLDAVNVMVTQEQITQAAGVEGSIEGVGTRVDQLADAATTLAPNHVFWYKSHATLDDVLMILQRGYGVGVEWQGLFYQTLEEQEENDDGEAGHYSIISYVDEELGKLIMVDPYKDFANQDRIISINTFLKRWWDKNDITDEVTGSVQKSVDEQFLFFMTPEHEYFPSEDGFKKFHEIR